MNEELEYLKSQISVIREISGNHNCLDIKGFDNGRKWELSYCCYSWNGPVPVDVNLRVENINLQTAVSDLVVATQKYIAKHKGD